MNNIIKQIVESKYNFNIDIDIEGNDNNSLSKSKYNSKSLKELIELMEEVVDLGLPSGTLWCKYNLGCNYDLLNNYSELAKSEDWYGDYYAWGELLITQHYKPYKFLNGRELIKYCGIENNNDNLTLLLPEDDAAYLNIHIGNFKFHIPTKDLCKELLKYTTYSLIENFNPYNKKINKNIHGIIFKSKMNENELFIPVHTENAINTAVYWTSDLDNIFPKKAWAMCIDYFTEEKCVLDRVERYIGEHIRPVINL